MLEIGPGVGFVTEKLVDLASKVTAVELDEDAIKVLEKTLVIKIILSLFTMIF